MNFSDIFLCSTDTVCGIGGPINNESLKKIYFLKDRPLDKKIMIVVGSIDQARQFKQWNNKADEFAQKYWPGAVSIIVNNQGFRMPNSLKMQKFLLKNGPMYLTSANLSGNDPLNLEQAKNVFKEITNVYDFCKPSNKPSDIYNVDTNQWLYR
ncbi:Sua5/YciO/YrdC/YwlC family protein [Mycoplasmopsis alligatoris]|uniref:L-threonylcarbamoyladenylate synthase n=1 Tax=Mycoplasmopsis alligatoris A21JP2 TaxID=747682 RepID=D4XX16_9BACT|nr:Sua5/YciO/YrdC/YwlC family protein [Mycoplasmopsis alligatoris]EFF41235.1 conserved hypothetical protein [Mycoplasmopsis alligatoris A21JP2]